MFHLVVFVRGGGGGGEMGDVGGWGQGRVCVCVGSGFWGPGAIPLGMACNSVRNRMVGAPTAVKATLFTQKAYPDQY